MANSATAHKPSRQGFSLIELLLVLAVLVLIGALALQSLSGTLSSAQLSQSSEQVRIAFTEAKVLAIDTSQPVVFRARMGTGEYRIEPAATHVDAGAMAAGAAETDGDSNGNLEEGVVFRSVACTSIEGFPVSVANQPAAEGEWSAPVVFMPTGVCYNAEVVIAHAGEDRNPERQRKIVLRGITCTASVFDIDSSGAIQ